MHEFVFILFSLARIFLGNNSNIFFSEVEQYDSSLWDTSMPKLSYNKGYVKK